MDLWLKLEQARNDNKDKIEKLQKMIEDKIPCDTLPEFLRPQAMLDCFNYVKLEKIMHEYQAHFKQEINEMEIELELNG